MGPRFVLIEYMLLVLEESKWERKVCSDLYSCYYFSNNLCSHLGKSFAQVFPGK